MGLGPLHVCKVVGAQTPVKKYRGLQAAEQLLQPSLGHGFPPAPGGEGKLLPHPLHRQRRPFFAVPLQGPAQPPLQGAVGEGGRDQDPGVGRVGGIALGHIQRPPLGGAVAVQNFRQLGQAAHRRALKVAHDAAEGPAAALPQNLVAAAHRVARAVIARAVHLHQPAPKPLGQADAQQLGSRPNPIGHVGGGEAIAPPPGLPPGGQGQQQFFHGISPL